MIWRPSHKFDRPAVALADRHYSHQKPGSPQFMPPGRSMVLLADNRKAVYGLSWPFAEYVKHAWAGAWVTSIFRNESAGPLASDMIRDALAIAQTKWPVPELGCITFVDPKKVRGVHERGELVKGFCFKKARLHGSSDVLSQLLRLWRGPWRIDRRYFFGGDWLFRLDPQRRVA